MKPNDELKELETELDTLSNETNSVGRRKKSSEEEKKSLERKRAKANKCAEKVSLRSILNTMLSENDCEHAKEIVKALIGNAESGDVEAFKTIYKVMEEEIGKDEDNNPLNPIRVSISFADDMEGVRDKE